MKARRAEKKYEIMPLDRARMRFARVGRIIKITPDTEVTVLESLDCIRTCYYCVMFDEFSHADTDVCPYMDTCSARYRPDRKSVYFRRYIEKD